MYPHLIEIAWLALMHCSTELPVVQLARVRLYALVVLSILVLALMGGIPNGEADWIICPPQVVVGAASRRCRLRGHLGRDRVSGGGDRWLHPLHAWHIPLMRSLLLWASWHLRGQVGPPWVKMVPWVLWLWQSGGELWPWLRRQPGAYGLPLHWPQCHLASGGGSEPCPQLMTVAKKGFVCYRLLWYNQDRQEMAVAS